MSGEEIVKALREEARGEAAADRLCTDMQFGTDYESRTPEQTLRWQAADLIERQANALMEVSKAGHLFKAHDIARAVLREG